MLAKHIELEDGQGSGHYVRSILRGNNDFFVILVTDAGFVCEVPNAPREARGPKLATVCLEEHCVLLHTSNRYETYHLMITPEGKIRKIPRAANNPTLDENTIKFSRVFRKGQENAHGGLKLKFQILDKRHLSNEYLLPFNARQVVSFRLPAEYRHTPKLNLIATVCCSIFNSTHPGFQPIYMDPPQQVRAARLFLKRLFVINPLLHPEIWPISFSKPKTSDWRKLTFAALENDDVIGFPKLESISINPVAIELISGPHALLKADTVLTYMRQLQLKGLNLTREQTIQALQEFPNSWKLYFTEFKFPADFQPSPSCPRWIPAWWDEDKFGPWVDLKIVRCKVPPSYKCATPPNFHNVVIAFGTEASDRLGLREPYSKIYFWYCYKCPSLNGTVSMDRHCAAFLKALSFKDLYKPTSKTVNVLNTVADQSRQTTEAMPPLQHSANIPENIVRRGQNRRVKKTGMIHPIYDINNSHLPFPPSLPSVPSAGSSCPPNRPSAPTPGPPLRPSSPPSGPPLGPSALPPGPPLRPSSPPSGPPLGPSAPSPGPPIRPSAPSPGPSLRPPAPPPSPPLRPSAPSY